MGYQGFFKILMITLISRKNLGGYKIMKHTVSVPNFRIEHELLPLDSNVRAKLTIMLKIKKFSKSFFSHIGNIK